ncbi:MAG: MarR family transcriptional regulator [Bacteroidales bacterium]|nr:MarR family transcriptional regulator [Bacteroidales bacterium]
MTSEERIRQQKELVEALGRMYEKEGLQPCAGRIIGLLLIMDKEQFTFDEIVEELQISKGSASNGLRLLEIKGLIEYITKPGDRKRYFQVKQPDKFSTMNDHQTKLKMTSEYLQAVLDLKADKNSKNSLLLKEVIKMIDFFLGKFEILKEEYLKQI